MSLSPRLIENVAAIIGRELQVASPGHCLRVDHLVAGDAAAICAALREVLTHEDEAYVLRAATSASSENDPLSISPERAIEIRNRKQVRLCLFVPADVVDAAASSLVNSFAVFDLGSAFGVVAKQLTKSLPEDVRAAANQAIRLSGAPAEHKADYLGAVAENPTLEAAGAEAWRLGLIPDVGGDGLFSRLAENRRCAQLLIRPIRAQTGPAERLEALRLRRGGVQRELLAFLETRRLRDARSWLPALSQEPYKGRITFERWTFEDAPDSDLEAINVSSFLNAEGSVEGWSKLRQPNGANSPPVATVGPTSKVIVKWDSVPKSPRNLHRWQAEVILSRDVIGDEDTGAELPKVTVAGKERRATLPLNVDLDGLPVHAVQVRVTAIDESGRPLVHPDGSALEGHSEEFWLVEAGDSIEDLEPAVAKQTVLNIPLARLKAAAETQASEIAEVAGTWSEGDLDTYSVTLNGRRSARVAVSPVLRAIQRRCIENPEEAGRYAALAEASERLTVDGPQFVALGAEDIWGGDAGSTFLARRKDVFRLLEKQRPRNIVEVADWRSDLSSKARSYAYAYQELLRSLRSSPEKLEKAIGVDTLHLSIRHGHGREDAMLVLPTHPLRVAWYAAYADLLGYWEHELCKTPRGRAKLLDLALAERLSPVNCPAFVCGADRTVFLFAQNLRFFWGLALPADARDPARRATDVTRVVGLDEREATLTDLSPDRVAEEIRAYRAVHPYLTTLRVNVLNPGSGIFVADSIRRVYTTSTDTDETADEEAPEPLNVEIIAHAHEPLPARLAPLADLQREVYALQIRGRHHHLAPLFSVALRPITAADRIPGGDVHISLAIDTTSVAVKSFPLSDAEDSASLYGLLVRFVPSFQESGGRLTWVHRLAFPANASREKHPSHGAYTTLLADTHREYIAAVHAVLAPTVSNALLGLVVDLSDADRSRSDTLHRASDWVITLDRFAGLELYDDAAGGVGSARARTYLLDYAPEFLEGIGHRMFVTTAHRGEVEEVLAAAMADLGFAQVEESVGEVLSHLKTISGRLALRVLGDPNRAREAVGLGAVAAYMRAQGQLDDAILIPVDAHPELFSPAARRQADNGPRVRCDLIRIQYHKRRLVATFIEVKSRAAAVSDELFEQMADQVGATEAVFRDLFFRQQPPRLDHALQRSRLAAILRFYLRRAHRYGLIRASERAEELDTVIARLETGVTELKAERWGFVVNLAGEPRDAIDVRDTTIRFLTGRDFEQVGFSTQSTTPGKDAVMAQIVDQVPSASSADAPGDQSVLSEATSPLPTPDSDELSEAANAEVREYSVGDVIDDRFEVVDILGSGGFSRVFRVRDTVEDEERALKLFNSAAGYNAVRREISALRKIRHPHVVEVMWADKTRNGEWYLISEYVQGDSLEHYTKGDRVLRDREAVDVALDVLDALVAIHPDAKRLNELEAKKRSSDLSEDEFDEIQELMESGLVHRDIKPQNIMLTRKGAKLLDFNIASRVGDPVNTISGTPPYQAPDVDYTRWDVSTDLFAVGVTLYELTCNGEHPYADRKPMVGDHVRDPRQFRPDLHEDLAVLLRRACAPYRNERFQTAVEMRDELKTIRDNM